MEHLTRRSTLKRILFVTHGFGGLVLVVWGAGMIHPGLAIMVLGAFFLKAADIYR